MNKPQHQSAFQRFRRRTRLNDPTKEFLLRSVFTCFLVSLLTVGVFFPNQSVYKRPFIEFFVGLLVASIFGWRGGWRAGREDVLYSWKQHEMLREQSLTPPPSSSSPVSPDPAARVSDHS